MSDWAPSYDNNGKLMFTRTGLRTYSPGNSKPSLFSATDRNVEIRAINSILNMQVAFVDGSPGRLIFSDSNCILELPPGGEGGGGGATGGTKEMRVKTVYGDHLDCCEITDTGLSGPTTPVAKSSRNRRSISSESIPLTDGSGTSQTVSYTYASLSGFMDYRRKASASGAIDQYELLVPIYLSGDIVLVSQIGSVTLDSVACTWEEAVPRKWCQYA